MEMRTECERCHIPLGMESNAWICSYECTYCESCNQELQSCCPNCGGELVIRPKRRPQQLPSVQEPKQAG